MCLRSVGFGLVAGLWLMAVGGCQKSSPSEAFQGREPELAQPKSSVPETVARLHWLGKKRLEGETNAAFFMSIWDLPESSKLEAQTLDKLALWLTGLVSKGTNTAAAMNSEGVGLVRPLLEDLLREESYFEVQCATNQPGEMALAIKLNEDRAGIWETNLSRAFAQLASATPVTSSTNIHAWQLEFENQKSKIKNRVALDRVGTWTLVTVTRWLIAGNQLPSGGLLKDLAARIQGGQPPFAPAATNFFLEADFDLRKLAGALACPWDLPTQIPRVSLTMIGDGLNVRTRGELAFSKPLNLVFEPWNIPTNLIHDPLVSFTAINGTRPLLASLPAWTNLNIGTPPNQFYLWGMEGAAVETFFAAPMPDASNTVYSLSGRLMERFNPWLTANKMGELERSVDLNGLSWKGFPFVSPFLKSVTSISNSIAFGGLGPEQPRTNSMPDGLIEQIRLHQDLVCYDWEVTAPRIVAAIYTSQLLRVMSHKAQLPDKSASMLWLKGLSSKLGNCGTEITAPDLSHLSFVRRSSVGLTAAELHLLSDWLESPTFPFGLHSVVAPTPRPPDERTASRGISR